MLPLTGGRGGAVRGFVAVGVDLGDELPAVPGGPLFTCLRATATLRALSLTLESTAVQL